jgi:hypothetical protein
MRRIPRLAGSLILWAGLNLAGCVAVPVGGYYGAWYAPYGERYVTSEGLVVTYDSGPGSYVVVGRPGLYWWNGYYYRRHGGYWERSHHHRGPWVYRPADRVPFLAHKRAREQEGAPRRAGAGTLSASWLADESRERRPAKPSVHTTSEPAAPPRQGSPWMGGHAPLADVPYPARGWAPLPGPEARSVLPAETLAWQLTAQRAPPAKGQQGHAPGGWRPRCPPGTKCRPEAQLAGAVSPLGTIQKQAEQLDRWCRVTLR